MDRGPYRRGPRSVPPWTAVRTAVYRGSLCHVPRPSPNEDPKRGTPVPTEAPGIRAAGGDPWTAVNGSRLHGRRSHSHGRRPRSHGPRSQFHGRRSLFMDRDPVFMDRDPDFMDRGPIFMDGGPVFMDGGPIFVDRGPVRRPAGRNGTLLVLSVQFHFPHEQTYFSLKRQCFFCPRPGVRGARTAVRGMDAVHESGTAVHENGTAVHEIGTAVHENGTAVRPRIQGSYGEGQNAPF